MNTAKPQMLIKWLDEPQARPVPRATVAATIRKNRRQPDSIVKRLHGETYVACPHLGVACCFFRAA